MNPQLHHINITFGRNQELNLNANTGFRNPIQMSVHHTPRNPRINFLLCGQERGISNNQNRRYSCGEGAYDGMQGLAVRDRNIDNSVNMGSISNRNDKLQYLNTPRDKKIVSKNTIKPTHKPTTLSIQAPKHLQVPVYHAHLRPHAQPSDCILDERLKQLRISESIEPIVHPYRDRSTDSYHYGHGYGHRPTYDPSQSHNNSVNASRLKQAFDNRPTASIDYPSVSSPELQAEAHIKYFMELYNNLSKKVNKVPHTGNTNTNAIPHIEVNLQEIDCIKEDVQNQKDSKEMYHNGSTEQKQQKEYNEHKENKELKEVKWIGDANICGKGQGMENQRKYAAGYGQRLSVDPVIVRSQQQIQVVPSAQKESQLQKCNKIKYFYEPYSMNLTSNHKQKSPHSQPIQQAWTPAQIQKNLQSPSHLQSPWAAGSLLQKLQNNPTTLPKHKIGTSEAKHLADPQYQYGEEESEQNLPVFVPVRMEEDEDKWDKILRKRQQTYNRNIIENAGGQLDSFHKMTHVPRTLEQMGNKSIYSYQSSFKEKDNYDQSVVEQYTGWTPEHVAQQESTRNIEPQKQSKNDENSQSYKNFSEKMQQISNSIKPSALNPYPNPIMKYSYSFQQTKETHYKTQKQLFNRFLYCENVEWMLFYGRMEAYLQNNYGIGKGDNKEQQNMKTNENANRDKFVSFVKIGDSGQEVYANRVLGHYIGVWLLGMGYNDSSNKQRILQNIQLIFTKTQHLIVQNPNTYKEDSQSQFAESSEPKDSSIREISQILYNSLFHGYLPANLQLAALLQLCRRGWEYLTITICKILKLLVKENKKYGKKSSREKIQQMNASGNRSGKIGCGVVFGEDVYKKLEIIVNAEE